MRVFSCIRDNVANMLYPLYFQASHTSRLSKEAPKTIGDPPTLDQYICLFLSKHEIDVKPASFKQGGKAATILMASTGNPFLISQYGVLKGQEAAVAVQEWTSWKQWAMAHPDWGVFLEEEKLRWEKHVKKTELEYQSCIDRINSPIIRGELEKEALEKSKLVANSIVGVLSILIGVGIARVAFVGLGYDEQVRDQRFGVVNTKPLSSSDSVNRNQAETSGPDPKRNVTSAMNADISKDALASQCKDLVGDIMGRSPSSMSTDYFRPGLNLVGISYIRSSDGKLWKYECTSDGSSIVWRGVDIFGPGEGHGRWREEDRRSLKS